MNSSDFGKMLKGQRILSNLTLRQLAATSGVSWSYLGRIERGERFPSVRILRRIAKPLGFEQDEILIDAGYIFSEGFTSGTETGADALGVDPHVALVLGQEPREVQATVLRILSILKFVGKVARSAELPELREYLQQKYPYLDEDWITMIEDLIAR